MKTRFIGLAVAAILRRYGELSSGRASAAGRIKRAGVAQIQFWKMTRRLKVCIVVPTKAAEIGNMATKLAPASAT